MLTSSSEEVRELVSSLPTLEGLYIKQTSTLHKPFSRFSISSLFKSSKPSLPSTTLLNAINAIAFIPPENSIKDLNGLIKAFEGLKEFATRFKEFFPGNNFDAEDEELIEGIQVLLEGYLSAIYVISRVLWDEPLETGYEVKQDQHHRATLLDCIRGFYLLYSLHIQLEIDLREIDKQILGSIFPPKETKFYQLSPLLCYPRKLITSLQTQPTRPIAHSSKIKSAIPSPIKSSFPVYISDEEALYVVSLLDTFLRGVQQVESLSGPFIAKTKKQKEEDVRRPLKIEEEVRVLKCDLLMSITTKKIADVKTREMEKVILDEKREGEEGDVVENGSVTGDDQQYSSEDVKPRLSGESDSAFDLSSLPRGTVNPDKSHMSEGVKWEDMLEECLIECLDSAKQLIEEGRAEVLSSHIEASDWLGMEGVNQPDTYIRKSKSPSHGPTILSDSESDSEDEFDSDTESETDDEFGGSNSYPCPLRTIFRLHDRYEEQRLAVWLHLPSARRGKMGWFMRGDDGKVGTAWDAFGLAAMMEYDTETLLCHGLGADKLDKWVELAAMKNAKKIKKRGGKGVGKS
ncbi:uncharacterized protein L201_000876 [Kwoniella dendrophila CBS 6074]|uniref:RNase III domain-containing protein n=1 Tax=Kwoniella dendrophila CBS 6074 TaxID=1295534 RepID=A0AAX4JKT9_9TREE